MLKPGAAVRAAATRAARAGAAGETDGAVAAGTESSKLAALRQLAAAGGADGSEDTLGALAREHPLCLMWAYRADEGEGEGEGEGRIRHAVLRQLVVVWLSFDKRERAWLHLERAAAGPEDADAVRLELGQTVTIGFGPASPLQQKLVSGGQRNSVGASCYPLDHCATIVRRSGLTQTRHRAGAALRHQLRDPIWRCFAIGSGGEVGEDGRPSPTSWLSLAGVSDQATCDWILALQPFICPDGPADPHYRERPLQLRQLHARLSVRPCLHAACTGAAAEGVRRSLRCGRPSMLHPMVATLGGG